MNRTIQINGKDVELYEVEPLNSTEKWNEYLMPNGDIVKVKLILTRIFTCNEKPDGKHQPYNFDFKPVTEVITVDLKKEIK
jgi:hypothetical protein